MLNYKCLVLDHDDTVVMSSRDVHYPGFLDTLQKMRPGRVISFEDYMRYSYQDGFVPMLKEIFDFTSEEIEQEYRMWLKWTSTRVPRFADGIREFIEDFVEAGGFLAAVTHSDRDNILRDYDAALCVRPALAFGWDDDPKKRKPAPYPILEAIKAAGVLPEETLMVDDLKTGFYMAEAAGVDFAGAGWVNDIYEIRVDMEKNAKYYLRSVDELRALVIKE